MTRLIDDRRVKVIIIGLMVLVLGIRLYIQYRYYYVSPTAPIALDRLPPQAYQEFHPNGIPGHPDQTIRQMKRLYSAMKCYSGRHNGQPASTDVTGFISDIYANTNAYGFRDRGAAKNLLSNADCIYSDDVNVRRQAQNFFPYFMPSTRPDGSSITGTRQADTRDVLAYTDLYFHSNLTWNARHTAAKQHPMGFFIVLWDNGAISRVPYEQTVFQPQSERRWVLGFPGQAGVARSAVPYTRYYRI